MEKSLEIDLNRKDDDIVEVSRFSLKPGDTLVVKIKSDYIDEATIDKYRLSLAGKFPKNEVMILGMAKEDDIELSVITKE